MESMLIFSGSLACLVGIAALIEARLNWWGFGRREKDEREI